MFPSARFRRFGISICVVEMGCFGWIVTSVHCKRFHSESSPRIIYFTIALSCRVTVSHFRIFRSDLTVRGSIPCTKIALNTINLVMAREYVHFFFFLKKKIMVVSAMLGGSLHTQGFNEEMRAGVDGRTRGDI
jgi:hypothetical protein